MAFLHIYCGDGKGKTTAALGLALRAAGAGMRVHIFQFLKGRDTSELHSLAWIPNIVLIRCDNDYGFTRCMTEQDKENITNCHNRMIEQAAELMQNAKTDLIILDEWNAAYSCGLLDKQQADRLILERNMEVELVLTGRNPDQRFLQEADYISEIHAVRHPYKKGIKGRKGIEY